MEGLVYKMFDDPALVDALITHIVDYYFGVSQRIFDAAADAIDIFFIGNDFGGQTGRWSEQICSGAFSCPTSSA